MATLTGQSIASSYEQLLHVDTDGGGNTTTLVPIKDGDNGTTFCLQLSTTKAMIEGNGSTLYFYDEGGESISADNAGVLSIAAGAEIDLTATAVDLNGTLDVSGTLTLAGNADFNGDLDVDGTTNLDVVDIDGAVDMASTLAVGGDINSGANYIVNEQGRQDHVANTMPAPYYRFDGSNDYIEATITQYSATSDWFAVVNLFATDVSGKHPIFGAGSSSGTYIGWSATNTFMVRGNAGASNTTTVALSADEHHVLALSASSGTVSIYIDGNLQSTVTQDGTVDLTWIGAGYDGSSRFFPGEISRVLHGNKALTATEVKQLYSGASVPFKYKGASQTELVTLGDFSASTGWTAQSGWAIGSNVLTASSAADNYATFRIATDVKLGKRYRVVFTVSGYSSGGVAFRFGANQKGTTRSSNATFSEDVTVTDATGSTYIGLVAVGTTSLVVDNFSIVQIGAVAEYDGSGVGASRWDDKSGNELHGTVSGATVENAPADADSGLTYEEGTWTGVVTDGTNPMNMNEETGFYTKIGNMVHITGNMATDSLDGGSGDASGGIRLSGLPFVIDSNGEAYTSTTFGYVKGMDITAGTTVGGYLAVSTSYMVLTIGSSAAGTTSLTAANWSSDGGVFVGFSYRAA